MRNLWYNRFCYKKKQKLLTLVNKRKVRKINKILNTIIILLLVLISLAYTKKELVDNNENTNEKTVSTLKTNSNLEVYYFDVGQADSILIRENDNNILIDAGNNEDGEKLVDYLKNDLNIEKFNMVVGTHPHEDHIGGLDNVIDSFDIDTILMPNATSTSKTFENVLDSIEKKDYKITVPKINEEFNYNNINIKVLYTGTDEKDLNNTSIVLKLTYQNNKFLFMGDATSKVEKKLLNEDIKSDVLKIGHHGSEYSTTKNFLDKVNPQYAIIEVGKNNTYKHPKKITLDKLNKKNIKIYRTDIDGTIKVASDGNNLKFETLKTDLDG